MGLNLSFFLPSFLPIFLPLFVCFFLSLFILFIYFLVWTLLPTHFRPTGLLLHLITRNHTHTHFVWFLWKRYWPITETLTWQHKIHKRQISVHPAGFEPTIPTSEWPQAHTLDCPDAGISLRLSWEAQFCVPWCHIVFSFNFILFSCFTVLVWDQPDETAETTAGDYKL